MANLDEGPLQYPEGIYQLENGDPIDGGPPNVATGAGMDNIPHLLLARRTSWLRGKVDDLLEALVEFIPKTGGRVTGDLEVDGTLKATFRLQTRSRLFFDQTDGRADIILASASEPLIVRMGGENYDTATETVRFEPPNTDTLPFGTSVVTRSRGDLRYVQRDRERFLLRVVRAEGVSAGQSYSAAAFEQRAFNPQTGTANSNVKALTGTWSPEVAAREHDYVVCQRIA